MVRPYLRQALEVERRALRAVPDGSQTELLHLSFPWESWNQMVDELRVELEGAPRRPYPIAESYRPDLDHCFFGWYSAAIRGTGEMYPCCMLISPDYEPIGDLRRGSVTEQWHGEGFNRLRHEMREVFLRNGRIDPDGMEALRPQCVEAGRCGLKSMYFRADEAFYQELGEAMDQARRRQIGWRAGWRGLRRAAGIFGYRVHWGLRTRWVKLRQRWFRLRARRLPWLIRAARVHMGFRGRPMEGVLEGWVRLGFRGAPASERADRVIDPEERLPYRRVRAVHVERVLETLRPDAARAFLASARESLVDGGVLRLVSLDPEALAPVVAAPLGTEDGNSARPPARTESAASSREQHCSHRTAVWSGEELERELRRAGFAEITACEYGRSAHSWLRNLEDSPCTGHGPADDERRGVLVVEATVPEGGYPAVKASGRPAASRRPSR